MSLPFFIEEKIPLWMAFSEFYLDSEQSDDELLFA